MSQLLDIKPISTSPYHPENDWVDGSVAGSTLIDWVEQLKVSFMDFSITAGDHSTLAKYKMKVQYDKTLNQTLPFFPWLNGLSQNPWSFCKISNSWDCPFEVLRQVTPVMILEISIPNSPKNKRIVHSKRMAHCRNSGT